jgi:alkylated DNA repair dioxygenase AlkB
MSSIPPPSPSPSPSPMLVVLDVDETLVYSRLVHSHDQHDEFHEPDVRAPNVDFYARHGTDVYAVTKRPDVDVFLRRLHDDPAYDVAVWSASHHDYLHAVLAQLVPPHIRAAFKFVWDGRRCVRVSLRSEGGVMNGCDGRVRKVKHLRKVWHRRSNAYTRHSVWIVDDTPHTYSRNYGNALPIASFTGTPRECARDDALNLLWTDTLAAHPRPRAPELIVDLCDDDDAARTEPEPVSLVKHARVIYRPDFLTRADADALFDELSTHASVKRRTAFGRPLARHTAVFGDEPSRAPPGIWGDDARIEPWTPVLRRVLAHVRASFRVDFNVCLVNVYADGRESIGWHSDKEERGLLYCIASLSLGVDGERDFSLRTMPGGTDTARKAVVEEKVKVTLAHGSMLAMHHPCQDRYLHALLPCARVKAMRINVTFRVFHYDDDDDKADDEVADPLE